MKSDFASAIGQMAWTAPDKAGLTEETAKGKKAARDFESVLLTSLFDSLQKAFALDAGDQMPGAADYRAMGTKAIAEAVSARGGIGIAELILHHLPLTKVPGSN